MADTQAVRLLNITKKFSVSEDEYTDKERIKDGAFFALDDISFTLEKGGCTMICGANGSGKSLLMSIIAGLEELSSGSVSTSSRVGLIFQEPDNQILGETAREDIAFGPANLGLAKETVQSRTIAALAETGLTAIADFPARSLSGGEKRRLAVAGVLAMDAEIIIFDEPYANMDYHGVVQINSLVKKILAENKTIIILTHEVEKCLALANRFIVLFKGRKVYDGSAQDALLLDLESWGIHNPLGKPVNKYEDMLWQ
ncbi:MAG: energy-coupling factor ABC transporter ATP-binding protein [Treponema sp.]|nr:energy-coupling factor ABC transporter ATP-binding protein [Treponema sp.]